MERDMYERMWNELKKELQEDMKKEFHSDAYNLGLSYAIHKMEAYEEAEKNGDFSEDND